MEFKIVEMFDSIEGEGKRAGTAATFIRLAGCNLNCSYCDTKYANQYNSQHNLININHIINKVNNYYKKITLTGGEPLITPNVHLLVQQLLNKQNEVNIETNGSIDVNEFRNMLEKDYGDKLFFTVDYKLPSSEFMHKMLQSNYENLFPWDVIKFVVASDQDVNIMTSLVDKLTKLYENQNKTPPHFYTGAVYNKYNLQKLAHTLTKTPELCNVKLQLQLHKIIWGPNTKGV